jgi:chemotaxis protein methyltransferase CheR
MARSPEVGMGPERESQSKGSDISGRLEEEIYRRLRDLVMTEGGIDLELYKNRCVLRRIALRQRACGAPDLRVYLRRVTRDPIERAQLVKALTIHVSQFFRNPSTFRAIEREALSCILSDKERTGARALRFWSVGCACGEEPYSLGMLLTEVAPDAIRRYSTAIYGTDIDPGCLRRAQEGRYPAISLKSIPARWKQRYFTPIGADYHLVPEVRRLVYFKQHSILDPMPFGRIDLVVFRNVLIYMTEQLQERVLLAIHGVLNVGGFLVLGKVEGLVGAAPGLFDAVNVPERIYRKHGRPPASRRGPAGLAQPELPIDLGLSA